MNDIKVWQIQNCYSSVDCMSCQLVWKVRLCMTVISDNRLAILWAGCTACSKCRSIIPATLPKISVFYDCVPTLFCWSSVPSFPLWNKMLLFSCLFSLPAVVHACSLIGVKKESVHLFIHLPIHSLLLIIKKKKRKMRCLVEAIVTMWLHNLFFSICVSFVVILILFLW